MEGRRRVGLIALAVSLAVAVPAVAKAGAPAEPTPSPTPAPTSTPTVATALATTGLTQAPTAPTGAAAAVPKSTNLVFIASGVTHANGLDHFRIGVRNAGPLDIPGNGRATISMSLYPDSFGGTHGLTVPAGCYVYQIPVPPTSLPGTDPLVACANGNGLRVGQTLWWNFTLMSVSLLGRGAMAWISVDGEIVTSASGWLPNRAPGAPPGLEPTPTPTPTPTRTPEPGGGGLPDTGQPLGFLILLALASIGMGGLALVLARRPNRPQ